MTSMDGSDWQASPDTLDELRVKIDQVDQQIHQLLNQRAVFGRKCRQSKI